MADKNSTTDRDRNSPMGEPSGTNRETQSDRNSHDPDRSRQTQPGTRDEDLDRENLDVNSDGIQESDSNAARTERPH